MSSVTPPTNVPPPPANGAGSTAAVAVNAPQALQTLTPGQSVTATLAQQLGANQIRVDTPLGPMTLQTAMALPRGAQLVLVLGGHSPQPTFQITSINGRAVGNAKGAATGGTQAASQTTGQATGLGATAQPLRPGQSVTATLVRPATGPAAPNGPGGAPGAVTGPQAAPVAAPSAPGAPQAPSAQGSPGRTQPTPGQGNPGGARTGPTGTPTGQASPSAGGPGRAGQGGQPSSPPGSAVAQGGGQDARQAGGTSQGGRSTPPGQTAPAPASVRPAAQPPSTPQTGPAPARSDAPPAGRAGANATTLAAGTRFRATVQRIDAPGTHPGTVGGPVKPLSTGQVLTGAITGRTPAGQPIVQTPGATFALSGGTLAQGAQVALRLDTQPLPPLPPGGAADGVHGAESARQLMGARAWSDMEAALRTLAQADPGRLTQVAQNALPQPGAKLSNQMLFFLSALKGGNLRGLLGDASLRVLENERPDLAQRMGTDFQTMARLADEPQTGDWRLALIPLWTGEKLDQLRLFWRQGGGGGEDGEDGEETRFVLDVDLSRMGHMQIDGLVKARTQRLDLIVRTDTPLPDDMQSDIGEIFASARELTGLSGQLGFQAAPGNFVDVPTPNSGPDPLGGGLMA